MELNIQVGMRKELLSHTSLRHARERFVVHWKLGLDYVKSR